jgi:hypothetical protein
MIIIVLTKYSIICLETLVKIVLMFLNAVTFVMLHCNTHYAGHGNRHATGLSHTPHDTLPAPNKTNWVIYGISSPNCHFYIFHPLPTPTAPPSL